MHTALHCQPQEGTINCFQSQSKKNSFIRFTSVLYLSNNCLCTSPSSRWWSNIKVMGVKFNFMTWPDFVIYGYWLVKVSEDCSWLIARPEGDCGWSIASGGSGRNTTCYTASGTTSMNAGFNWSMFTVVVLLFSWMVKIYHWEITPKMVLRKMVGDCCKWHSVIKRHGCMKKVHYAQK